MTEEKKKVRDLATELGMQPKEVLATAKRLGIISAKVAASTLSDVDYSRLRTQLTGGNDKRDEVKVRRRRKDEKSSSVDAPSSGDIKEKTVGDQKEVAEKKVKEPLSPVSTASAPAVAGEDVRPASNQAKIINLSGKSILPPASPVEQVNTTLSSEEVAVLATPEVEKDTLVAENANNTEKEKISVAEKKEPARPVDQKKDQAKIIRPATFSAEPERTSSGKTVSSAPGMNGRTGSKSEKTNQNASVEQKAVPSPNSSVRVISRPDPQQATKSSPHQGQDRQNQPARQGQDRQNQPARQGQDRQGGNKQGQQNRAGSGRPGGGNNFSRGESSAPQQDRNLRTVVPLDQAQEDSRKKRQKGRRTVDFASGGMDRRRDEDAGWSKASNRKNKNRKQREAPPVGGTQPVKAIKRKIKVEEFIRVSDLAHQMGLKSSEIIKALFALGVMATINQTLDIETATLVAIEFGYEIEKVGFSEKDFLDTQHAEESPGSLLPRPPVVTIMGHVDHGKTSLLDAIRKSSVVTGEAGGITQHIGAYHVETKKGEIVFLDTPGHEAFTAMRARGAEVTDIVVLVVAADDGVMEQTKEAINHAKAANVPIMVAVNKIDKPGAEPDRVKRELADFGLVPEEWGGETVFSYVSAKQGDGLDDLLELLALQAEVLELKANPNRLAVGHIVEAKLDKGRGSLGTVLIQQGTLRLGDSFVCGTHSGRVRAMFDDQGKKVKEATPSMPVEVQGFEGVPEAGEEFICIADEKTARRIADSRAMKQRERELARESKITLETFLASRVGDVEAAVLNLVVKADVRGSLEAIIDAMTKLSTEKVRINVIHGGTGAVSESDVLLAAASNAIIIGFNVRPSAKAKDLAQQEKVDIRFYDIIYKLVEEIRSAMEGMLAPVSKEVVLGTADVREVFSVPKVGTVAGSHVSDGKIVRGCNTRLLRDGVVVHTGKLGSLRRFKDDVKEVAKGYECGISIEGFNDIKVGDAIEAFEIVEEAATL